MKRAIAILTLGFALCGVCLGLSQQTGRSPSPAAHEPERQARVETGLRFEAFDLFVDSGEISLAAYQIEVVAGDDVTNVRKAGGTPAPPEAKASKTKITLVGVEGGEHAAFKNAPYYDPAALHEDQLKDRIILAAFNTGPDLPTGKTRVARIHIQVEGPGGEPTFTVIVKAAATADGTKIQATAAAAAAGDAR